MNFEMVQGGMVGPEKSKENGDFVNQTVQDSNTPRNPHFWGFLTLNQEYPSQENPNPHLRALSQSGKWRKRRPLRITKS